MLVSLYPNGTNIISEQSRTTNKWTQSRLTKQEFSEKQFRKPGWTRRVVTRLRETALFYTVDRVNSLIRVH